MPLSTLGSYPSIDSSQSASPPIRAPEREGRAPRSISAPPHFGRCPFACLAKWDSPCAVLPRSVLTLSSAFRPSFAKNRRPQQPSLHLGPSVPELSPSARSQECLQHDWLTAASKVPAADVTPVQAHHASLTKPRAWPQSEDSRNASRHDLAHCCPTEGPDWFSGSVSSTGWRQPLRGYGTKRPALPTILPPISMQTSLLSLAGQDGTKGQLI
eukprot:2387347-Pleurochrysis_carterae.AAC.4